MNSPHEKPEPSLDALPIGRAELVQAARSAFENAHSPYSGVRVGAALVDGEGRVFVGCNVENASFGLTLCAERCAIGRAVVEGGGDLVAIAICSNRELPLMPCGACRQVMMEFAPELLVICEGSAGGSVVSRLKDLLPQAFSPGDLDG